MDPRPSLGSLINATFVNRSKKRKGPRERHWLRQNKKLVRFTDQYIRSLCVTYSERKAAQLLTDTQALLDEKEAELFATRDTAYKDMLLAAERIAYLEERMEDLLVVLKESRRD